MVAERSQWWIPRAVDRHIAARILDGVEEILAELRRADSDGRARFRAAIEGVAADLVTSPAAQKRVAEIKDRLLEQTEVQDWLAAVWDDLRRIVLDDLAAPNSRTRAAMAQGLASLGRTLASDREMLLRNRAFVPMKPEAAQIECTMTKTQTPQQ